MAFRLSRTKIGIACIIMSARTKKKSTAPPKSYNKEVAVQVGCELELELWRAPDLYKVIPIKFGCKGTKNSRDYQGCALFN